MIRSWLSIFAVLFCGILLGLIILLLHTISEDTSFERIPEDEITFEEIVVDE